MSAPIKDTLWVFGYGSLCWNPGFEYTDCVVGYIRGYVRRFWQGNTTHRGTTDKPGRVATLIGAPQGITYGCAFQISGREALDYLEHRECSLGGYVVDQTKFYPHMGIEDEDTGACNGETFPVLLYIATEQSCHWQGETSLRELAQQICECRGASGHNVEYVLRLAEFIRNEIPEIEDGHLFELERLIHQILDERKITLSSVMGGDAAAAADDQRRRLLRNAQTERRPISFEFRSRVAPRKLRCLHI